MPGEDAIRQAVDGAPTSGDDDKVSALRCPVTAMGHRGGVFYYRTAAGELYAMGARDHTSRGLLALMGGDTRWLYEAHPRRNGEGATTGWLETPAAADLMRRCAQAGFFNPARQVRGPGVWAPMAAGVAGEDAPTLVVHCGDALLYVMQDGDSWRSAGVSIGNIFYAASPPERRPAEEALSAVDAHEILTYIEQWNWRAPRAAPRLLFGWICTGYLAGALRWRPHVWTTGDLGTGKSTLEQAMENLYGDIVLRAAAPTPASLWQALAGAARPILLDEIEYDAADPRSRDVVKVARMASTNGQAPLTRGSAGGTATAYHVRAGFYCTSIYMPPLEPQDQTRFTVLELDPLRGGAEAATAARAGLARMAELGPRLYRRMVDRFELLQANLAVYGAAFAAGGRDSRFADQVGTLLAAADTALCDHPVGLEDAQAFIADSGVIEIADPVAESGAELCLNHLLTSALPHWRQGRLQTVGEVLAEAVGNKTSEATRELRACGIGWDFHAGEYWILIANQNAQLTRIFEGSRWANIWDQPLRRLPRAERGGTGRFGAGVSRYVAVPLSAAGGITTPLPPGEAEAQAAAKDRANWGDVAL